MISSTFLDLEDHRKAMERAIQSQDLMPIIMENDGAKADLDIIGSSLNMVQKSAGYVLIIGQKYGQTPECRDRNPNGLSVTELEFNEALSLGHPILLFIMDDKHLLSKDQIEKDDLKEKKLNVFRERAKKFGPESGVERVYAQFKSLEEFEVLANKSIPNLKKTIEERQATTPVLAAVPEETPVDGELPIPHPPALYAQPPYISNSDKFVGRRSELESIDDWARPGDQHAVMLFDAIGGNGKSALTWEWTTNNATKIRQDWEGIFWYSFYERGAQMSDFCQHALAYITQKPVEEFYKIKTPKLAEMLLAHLQERPWLLILDGLERVLVAYNRIDAAQMLDEDADNPEDKLAKRDPIACIRGDDDDLLRRLAGANPSKILVSTRLVPKVLINKANQPIHGVIRKSLGGLRPPDAEELLRTNGVHGDSAKIQEYLQTTCNCHPLVIGVLAGLIQDYFPDRGNFDKWVADPEFGGSLNLADLDLVQSRNHIVKYAIDTLEPDSKKLLSILSLLSTSIDYVLLKALDPGGDEKELAKTIKDLERRGLVQYDHVAKHWDLHPVVRGIASRNLDSKEKATHGNRIVEYLSSLEHKSFEEAETLEDLAISIHVVQVQVGIGRLADAYGSGLVELLNTLFFSLENHAEVIAIAKPFFSDGWSVLPRSLNRKPARLLGGHVAEAFYYLDDAARSQQVADACIASALKDEDWRDLLNSMVTTSKNASFENRTANHFRVSDLTRRLLASTDSPAILGLRNLDSMVCLLHLGRILEAKKAWQGLPAIIEKFDPYRSPKGNAEYVFAWLCYCEGTLDEATLRMAEAAAREGKRRNSIRDIIRLRGNWHLDHERWSKASQAYGEALRMAREAGLDDRSSDRGWTLAQVKLGLLKDPLSVVEALDSRSGSSSEVLAYLWQALGNLDRSREHALAYHEWAWADGDPYHRRWNYDRALKLLAELGAKPPDLPPHDPSRQTIYPWEADVETAIMKLEEKKAERERKRAEAFARGEDPDKIDKFNLDWDDDE